ncbi:hypothetical protein ACFFJX_20260 [Pseudarcicella hirudinis]|uniref:hypothetical protein n=1 Tax=Pseudarcicella hirudinis TaxID=1079859 RepID=UPI0035EE6310
MKKYNFLAIILLVIALASCKNDGIYGVRDAVATDAITVDNATFYERYPFTTTSVSAGGKIEIRLNWQTEVLVLLKKSPVWRLLL